VSCSSFREAISARLDGQPVGDDLDAHLAGCADCRAWEAHAIALTRTMRLAVAEPVPDLTGPILARVQAASNGRVIQLVLGFVALAQALAAVPALLGNEIGATVHVAHEQAAWGLALAAAFAIAAWRPARADALIPVLGVFVLCLAVMTGIDVGAGRVSLVAEAPHTMSVFGLALLWLELHPPAAPRLA
jgi:predicted anti-sigma-YlaC factor YlaD